MRLLPGFLLGLLIHSVVFAIFVAISARFVSAGFAFFAAGMGVGAVAARAGLTWRAGRVMPVLLDVIDWGRVDRLLDERDGP